MICSEGRLFAVLLVFVYHLAEAGIDPTATPNPYPISSSCPRPLFSHNCYPPKYSQKMTPPPSPTRGKSLNSHMSAKALERSSEEAEWLEWRWEEKSKGWSLIGPRQLLWPKLKVMGTLSRLWAEKCYFLAYVWWYHTGCSTKKEDARRDQRQKQRIHLEASTGIQVREDGGYL